jgi:hypothetical protein
MHYLAANLAVIVATIHIALGVYNWYRYARIGIYVPPDLRWPLFVASGVAVLGAIVLVARGWPRRPFYLGGIGLMIVYIVGYFWWHIGGHRLPFAPGPRTHHHGPLSVYILDHIVAAPPYTQLALATELLLLLGLLVLLAHPER